jgi:hypothetical protein
MRPGKRRERYAARMRLRPITLRAAAAFVRLYHRHHLPPVGHKFSVAVEDAGRIVGVAIVGRPVARMLDDGLTLEVTRVATDGTPNACSVLYGAARRVAKHLGYRRIVTYTLRKEPGTSLKASGWRRAAIVAGHSWNRRRRPRNDHYPASDKQRWECLL